jgi:hypothetical protein
VRRLADDDGSPVGRAVQHQMLGRWSACSSGAAATKLGATSRRRFAAVIREYGDRRAST